MRATFLGTADGHTSTERQHSGVFLHATNFSLLLDCGASVAQFFKREKIDPNHPRVIWLSHMHSDHVGQFPLLIQSLWLRQRKAPLTVYAPKIAVQTLRDYLTKCLLFPELIGFPILWHEIKPKKTFQIEGHSLTPFPTTHLSSLGKFFAQKYPQTSFDCFGVTIETTKGQIVYSSDLGHPKDIQPPLKKPTRALICELTHLTEKSLFEELALVQPIKQMLITHYPDHLGSSQARLQKLATAGHFNSKIKIVKDGQTIPI